MNTEANRTEGPSTATLAELNNGSDGYDAAHREAGRHEQDHPCTCQRNARERSGGALYPSLIALVDLDPDCELHCPWVREDDVDRVYAMRLWLAGYQAGYATRSASVES